PEERTAVRTAAHPASPGDLDRESPTRYGPRRLEQFTALHGTRQLRRAGLPPRRRWCRRRPSWAAVADAVDGPVNGRLVHSSFQRRAAGGRRLALPFGLGEPRQVFVQQQPVVLRQLLDALKDVPNGFAHVRSLRNERCLRFPFFILPSWCPEASTRLYQAGAAGRRAVAGGQR